MIDRRSRELSKINSLIARKADELASAVRMGEPWQHIQREIAALRKNAEAKAAEPIPQMACTKCGASLDAAYSIFNASEAIDPVTLSVVPMPRHLPLPFCLACRDVLLAEYEDINNA